MYEMIQKFNVPTAMFGFKCDFDVVRWKKRRRC